MAIVRNYIKCHRFVIDSYAVHYLDAILNLFNNNKWLASTYNEKADKHHNQLDFICNKTGSFKVLISFKDGQAGIADWKLCEINPIKNGDIFKYLIPVNLPFKYNMKNQTITDKLHSSQYFLDMIKEYLIKHPKDIFNIIVVKPTVPNEHFPDGIFAKQALAVKEYLVKNQISEDQIIIANNATDPKSEEEGKNKSLFVKIDKHK